MVEILQTEGEGKKFPKEPIDKDLLLSSLRDYAKDGVILGVEKMIEPRKNAFGKVTLNVLFTVIGSFPKCRKYILDDEGQYTYYTDERTGEERRDIEVGEGNLCTVFFPFYAVPQGDELDENTPLLLTPGTSSYSFFREGFIDAEELPADMNGSFTTTFKEIKETFEGFTFRGKYAEGGSKRKFPYLKCERVDESDL